MLRHELLATFKRIFRVDDSDVDQYTFVSTVQLKVRMRDGVTVIFTYYDPMNWSIETDQYWKMMQVKTR